MDFYDLEEIKQRADCIDVAKNLLHIQVKDDRCAAVWRGGENKTSVHLKKDGWYDHAEKKGGTVIDLVMLCEGLSLNQAALRLGKYLNLTPASNIPDARKKVAEYVYTNDKGEPVHKSVRYKLPDGDKDFIQFHLEGEEWKPGLNGCETFPLRVTEFAKHDTILIHEGEKACLEAVKHGLENSTTFPMGSGAWKPEWAKWFKKKNVVILRDNDDAGFKHGAVVAWGLKDIAESIKALTPSKISKGDCYEYFNEEKGTKQSLLKLIEETPEINLNEIQEPTEAKESKDITAAKVANRESFKNYCMVDLDDGKSKAVPRQGMEMLADLKTRMLNFPRLCGGNLFDMNKGDMFNKTVDLRNPDALEARILKVTGMNTEFKQGCGFVNVKILFNLLHQTAERYQLISESPHYPPVQNVYYTYGELPPPSKDHHYFDKLCSYYCPSSELDEILIRVCIASLYFYEDGIDKPMWLIDTCDGAGQNTGKTKFVETICKLLHEEPFWITPSDFSGKNANAVEKINRRILSLSGRTKRVFLLDNVEHYFKSPELASFITQGSFSGIEPYGHGETSRINDLVFFITSNGGTFDRDLIDRSMPIHLNKPKNYNDNWLREVIAYVRSHKLQIAADVIDLLKRGYSYTARPQTRFKIWEQSVLMPLVKDVETFEKLHKMLRERKGSIDGELERAETIRDHIYNKLSQIEHFHKDKYNIDPEDDYVWIDTQILCKWCQEAIPTFGGPMGGHTTYILKSMFKTGLLKELSSRFREWPPHQKKGSTRGMMWNGEAMLKEMVNKPKEIQQAIADQVIRLTIGSENKVVVKERKVTSD